MFGGAVAEVAMVLSDMPGANYDLPDPIVTISPDWLGGEPCFTGRRVPIKALFDYLKTDHTLEEFLADFPSVSHEHAVAVIEWATKAIGLPDAPE